MGLEVGAASSPNSIFGKGGGVGAVGLLIVTLKAETWEGIISVSPSTTVKMAVIKLMNYVIYITNFSLSNLFGNFTDFEAQKISQVF